MAYRSGSIIILIVLIGCTLGKLRARIPLFLIKKKLERPISLPKIGTQPNPLGKNLSPAYRSGSIIILISF